MEPSSSPVPIFVNPTPTSVNASQNKTVSAPDLSDVATFNLYVLGIMGAFLAAFGLVANTLSIIVLRHRKMRSSTSYYLVTLALYDNVILISMIFFFTLPALYDGLEPDVLQDYHFNFKVIAPYGYPISLVAHIGSIYTCVAFTIERYIAVCRPLHAANTCTKSRAMKVMLLIFLWSILYNIPRWFHYTAESRVNEKANRTQFYLNETEFGRDYIFKQAYLIYFQLFFMFLIPFSILMVLNSALIRALRRSQKQRQQLSVSAAREHNLTVMLIAVVILFLICQFPSIIDNILLAQAENEQALQSNPHYRKFWTICSFMVEINSATNFIMYCVFGKKFRMVFLHMFGCKKVQKQLQYRSTIHNTNQKSCDLEVSLV